MLILKGQTHQIKAQGNSSVRLNDIVTTFKLLLVGDAKAKTLESLEHAIAGLSQFFQSFYWMWHFVLRIVHHLTEGERMGGKVRKLFELARLLTVILQTN